MKIKFRTLLVVQALIICNQEKKSNFNEASIYSNFFRIGKKNQWKKILSTDQVNLIENEFKEEMVKFNYL